MTISFPLIMPTDPTPSSVEWSDINVRAVSQNPYNGKSNVFAHPFEKWGVEVTYDPMPRAQYAAWAAFLSSLRGQEGTFIFHDELRKSPRGNPNGPGRVEGQGLSATNGPACRGPALKGYRFITLDGFWPNTIIFEPDDMVQIDNAVYRVLKYAVSDENGIAQIDVWPFCRGHAGDTPIDTTSPGCIMRLRNSVVLTSSADQSQLFVVGFSAEEVV